MRIIEFLRHMWEYMVYPREPKHLTTVEEWPVIDRDYPAVMSGLTVLAMVKRLMEEAEAYHQEACDSRNWWDERTVESWAQARDATLDAIDLILQILDEQEPSNLEPLDIPEFTNQHN